MKIHILYQITKTPAGGGNQFIRILDNFFKTNGVRAKSLYEADVVFFNSHHFIHRVANAKRRFPEKLFIHRIDGPMRLYNSLSDKRDHVVNTAAAMISDGTIFQSGWSRDENYRLGLHRNISDVVIHNAVDPDTFNRNGKAPFSKERKIKLIATSWSPNPRKGFDVYGWLDRHLDFSRFEMTFVGNSPITFRNIKHIKPLTSKALALTLKAQDIFVFASKMEACSNALLEALHCGLPAVAYNFSSNPEVIGEAGELFERPEEIPLLLDRIVADYNAYQKKIAVPQIEDVAGQYLDFIHGIHNKAKRCSYTPKRLGALGSTMILIKLFAWRFHGKVRSLKETLRRK